jgi:hypothetical protein
MITKLKVLMMCSNPAHERSHLQTTKEFHRVEIKLANSLYEPEHYPNPSPARLPSILGSKKPYIAHFSGHGDEQGRLRFVDEDGTDVVEHEEFARIFQHQLNGIRCVVLNACHSSDQARLIGKYVEYVVGMASAIEDDSAISFSEGFYESLAQNQGFVAAFRRGWNNIVLSGQIGDNIPRLYRWGQLCPDAHLENTKEDTTLTPGEIEQCRSRAIEQLVAVLESREGLQAHVGKACPDWEAAARGRASDLATAVLASPVKEFGGYFVGRMKAARGTSSPSSIAEGLRQIFEVAQPVVVAAYVHRRILESGIETINAKHPHVLEAMHAAMRGGPTRWRGKGKNRRPFGRLELSAVPEGGAVVDECVHTIIHGALQRDPDALDYYDPDDDLELQADALNNELSVHRMNGEPHYGAADQLDPGARALLLRLKYLLPDLDLFVSELGKDDKFFQNQVLGPQRLFYQAYDEIIEQP